MMSRNAKILIAIEAIIVALLWCVWSPLLFLWNSEHTSFLTTSLIIVGLSTRGLRRKLASEIASDSVPFRRFSYTVAKWLCLAIVIGQIAVAAVVGTVFIWVISSIIVVIAGALLLHEWTELREAEQKKPNQALQPTPMLVTDRADARSAPSIRVADL